MDSMLKGLFGDQDDDDQRRSRAQDFINRYDDGPPHENISDEEAFNHYQVVAGQLSPQDLEESAAAAYARMSPDERRQLAVLLLDRGGREFENMTSDDPRQLARMTTQLQARQPEGLASLLGGGVSGVGGLASGLLGGGGSQHRGQGSGVSDVLHNPIARAALGGIAAMAMKKMLR